MEAQWAFAELFSDTWHSVANRPDSGLTGDARELKRQMRELVRRTEPVKAAERGSGGLPAAQRYSGNPSFFNPGMMRRAFL